jgi:hypothetical protein
VLSKERGTNFHKIKLLEAIRIVGLRFRYLKN